jgi:hypothetical protein
MDAITRLERLFQRHAVSFSIEGLPDGLIHITLAKDYGSFQDVISGEYEDFDAGVHDCIDELEERSRRRSIKKV